jgi:hypothetical protein
MLKFEKGLRIKFWNVRNQITEGVIQFKTSLEQNAYIVDVVSSGSCIVHRDQISCVLLKDFWDNDVWVPIDNLYKSFSNGATITPDTRYDPTSIVFEPASLKVRFPKISTEALNYVISDEKVTKTTMLEWKLIPRKVIFNGPATVVMWEDGTKTVVKKTEDDTDDREKAVMFAILKKACGSRGNMNRYLKSFKEDKPNEEKKEEAGSSELCQCEQGAGEGSSESTV